VPKNTGKKRQYLPVTGSSKDEKQRNLDILDKLSKPPALDVTKVVVSLSCYYYALEFTVTGG